LNFEKGESMFNLRSTFALAALASSTAFAQLPEPPKISSERTFFYQRDGAGRGPQISITNAKIEGALLGLDGRVVKGAPYSGQAVTETTQVLADGNRIGRKNVSAVARDSEGRTRREENLSSIGPLSTDGQAHSMVFINDPVAQVNYVLDPSGRTANKMPAARFRRPAPEQNSAQMDAARMHKLQAEKEAKQKEQANSKTESLGTQIIGGVQATGTRRTRTIPAGQIGNDRPIVIVSETWYSPELQEVVMSKRSDPRSGETTYTLNNIQRAEPDPSLFAVPTDYTVQENSSHVFVRKTER
jgi:hypothetical protein